MEDAIEEGGRARVEGAVEGQEGREQREDECERDLVLCQLEARLVEPSSSIPDPTIAK